EHLPDRLEHLVPGGHLVEQPVALDGGPRVARVDGDQVEFVPLRRAVLAAEDGDDPGETGQATGSEHRHRPRAGDLRGPRQIPEAAPGPQVVRDNRPLVGGGHADGPALRAEPQSGPRLKLTGLEAEVCRALKGPVGGAGWAWAFGRGADQMDAEP